MNGKMFRIGERVRWKSSGGTAEGEIVRIATESGRIGDFVYNASREDPRYIIVTDEGNRAAHRAEALSRSQSVEQSRHL